MISLIRRLQRLREARVLKRRPIPDALWDATVTRYPFIAGRSAEDRALLRRLATLFLAGKEFHGAAGFQITDEVAVAIAAQACLPVLHLGLHWYDGFVGVVVHEDEVRARRETVDEDGVVHEYDEWLTGEAMDGGPLMLTWNDVRHAGDTARSGYNVVIHEFTHVIDMRDGPADGVPPIASGPERERWRSMLDAELERLRQRLDRQHETLIDPYAAEGPEEFFAVASEAFFVAPHDLVDEHPAVYAALGRFFQQDPVAVLPREPRLERSGEADRGD